MNCKQGDKAMVVRIPPGQFGTLDYKICEALLGRVVVCARLSMFVGEPTWYFEEIEVVVHPTRPGAIVECQGMWDSCLVPLRDHGDDAVAEELRRIRVRETEGV